MHEVLVNRLGGLSLPRKSVVRLTDRPDMTLDVYRRRKTTIQQPLVGLQLTDSGSTMFSYRNFYGNNYPPETPETGNGLIQMMRMDKSTGQKRVNLPARQGYKK